MNKNPANRPVNPNPTVNKNNPGSGTGFTTGAINAEMQQLQQRLWVKDQEVTALKVQNRHLIGKLEESEKKAEPNQINTQKIATEIQNQLRPLISEIEKSVKDSFDILKSTMRGIYQQSQRAQQAVEDIGAHSKEVELRLNEQRKADQVYYQEKILSMVTSFGDRIERQLENRLRNLAVVELMNTKQNEALADIDMIKTAISELIVSNQNLRNEIKKLGEESLNFSDPAIEKLTEVFAESAQMRQEALNESMESEKLIRESVLSSQNPTDSEVIPNSNSENEKPVESKFTLDYL